jgi:hypothetical protein
VTAAGCGGDDQPSYCSDLDELRQSVEELGQVNVIEGGTSSLTKALERVETAARSTVDSARSEFPDEADAINDSVSALGSSAQQLAESPTAEQGTRVAGDLASVVNSVDDFADAARSDCE